MGRVLQIRVAAETPDPEHVHKAWPTLSGLIFVESFLPTSRQAGVLDLVDGLVEKSRFADLPDDLHAALSGRMDELAGVRKRLDEALADRDPKQADILSYSIEDMLDELEHKAAKA